MPVGAAVAIQLAPSGDDEQPVVSPSKFKDERIKPFDEPAEPAATVDPEPAPPVVAATAPTVPAPVETKPAEPTPPIETKVAETAPPVETKPVEAKPVEAKPIEAKPVGDAKPRTHTQRVAVVPHEAPPALVPAGRHQPIVTVKIEGMWGYVFFDKLDLAHRRETTNAHEAVTPGRHMLVIKPGPDEDQEQLAPMTCRITVPADTTRMNIKVNLSTRRFWGADSCE